MTRYQFVSWFPRWQGFGFHRYDPQETGLAMIYEWSLRLGWFEVRKWTAFCAGKRSAAR